MESNTSVNEASTELIITKMIITVDYFAARSKHRSMCGMLRSILWQNSKNDGGHDTYIC